MITEKLLHYIWANNYFNSADLKSSEGNAIVLLYGGKLNVNQGPDFLDARILVDQTLFAGNIELHVRSSEWELHGHDSDANYKNVILHVVWIHDSETQHDFPTLELQERIPVHLLNRYGLLMQSPGFIPCQNLIKNFPADHWGVFRQKLAVERLEGKSEQIMREVSDLMFHWEEIFWWHLARSFGFRVNADSFYQLAKSIPLTILAKHRSNLVQLESLLFGQAGMLNKTFQEKYPAMLRKEYHFLKSKYRLQQISIPLYFLRMRPANFPTIRLAQLASLVFQSHQLFTVIRQASDLKLVMNLLRSSPNDYWLYHYRFDEPVAFREKPLGDDMIRVLVINTVIPFLFAYGKYKDDIILVNRAISWLKALPSENNVIIRNFRAIGINTSNSLDSQSLLELKTEYCDNRNCLDCNIGKYLLGSVPGPQRLS